MTKTCEEGEEDRRRIFYNLSVERTDFSFHSLLIMSRHYRIV